MICGSWEGGGIFEYGRHSDYKDYYKEYGLKVTWYSEEIPF